MSSEPEAGDRAVRAMTLDGAFRVMAVVTTETARGALAAQRASGDTALRLAELITAGILIRETTQPARRVQMLWRDRRGGALVADALPDGSNRGMVNPGELTGVAATGDHILQVSYTMPNGALHQGMVAVAEGDDMGTALMRYMHQSEQTVSMVALTALPGPGPGGVRVAGGYLVQLLPEATPEVIAELTDHLGNLPPITQMLEGGEATVSAAGMIETVLNRFEHAQLASSPLRFGCTCSEGRVMLSILTLPDAEVDSMIAGDPLDVRCDACGARYTIQPDALRELRDMRAKGIQA
jgi:molecular chaperone Hsp33